MRGVVCKSAASSSPLRRLNWVAMSSASVWKRGVLSDDEATAATDCICLAGERRICMEEEE